MNIFFPRPEYPCKPKKPKEHESPSTTVQPTPNNRPSLHPPPSSLNPTNPSAAPNPSAQAPSPPPPSAPSAPKPTFVANSVYAMGGNFAGPNVIGTRAFVAVKNHCPYGSDWIPQKCCLSQFYETCSRDDK